MSSFWDRVWLVHAMAVRDYYIEREEQRKRWRRFCRKCITEILDESGKIAGLFSRVLEKQASNRVHEDIVKGVVQLPLYGFYLVLQKQREVTLEQSKVIKLFFKHFDIPYSMDSFIQATSLDNGAKRSLLDLVGVSESKAGNFWVQFFKVLYRTEEDTAYVQKVIDAFCAITMRFAALSGKAEDYVLKIMEKFLKDVHVQSVLCREIPNEPIDLYGDTSFVEHFNNFKKEAFKVCNYTMDENDEDLNPTNLIQAFSIGVIYQIVSRCSRSRADKVRMTDDILSQVKIGTSVDGNYIFKYMEDEPRNRTSLLAFHAHTFTDINQGEPMGWILLTRFSGTYELGTGENTFVIQEAANFVLGMENYLDKKYPMSGFGQIAVNYNRRVLEIINKDIDENVTIV